MTISSTQALIQSLLQHKKSINQASETAKNEALAKMATSLQAAQAEILAANQIDMENAHGHIAPVMLDRLKLTPERIAEMAQGILASKLYPILSAVSSLAIKLKTACISKKSPYPSAF